MVENYKPGRPMNEAANYEFADEIANQIEALEFAGGRRATLTLPSHLGRFRFPAMDERAPVSDENTLAVCQQHELLVAHELIRALARRGIGAALAQPEAPLSYGWMSILLDRVEVDIDYANYFMDELVLTVPLWLTMHVARRENLQEGTWDVAPYR